MNNKKTENTSIELASTSWRKKLFLDAFNECYGIIGVAAQKAGIHRKTYYRWRDADPDFDKKCDEILREQPAVVKDILLKRIMEGHDPSIHFYLTHKHVEFIPKKPEEKELFDDQPKSLEELLDASPMTSLNQDQNATNEQRRTDTGAAENSDETRADSPAAA